MTNDTPASDSAEDPYSVHDPARARRINAVVYHVVFEFLRTRDDVRAWAEDLARQAGPRAEPPVGEGEGEAGWTPPRLTSAEADAALTLAANVLAAEGLPDAALVARQLVGGGHA
ncbi:hypothetical protein [Methylobacterium nigriterrae]|uniref:hypothetical protein n=1 Tax=Methylobacterium nigriterrae TaxID=3127512 RepID=UPI0030132D71